MTAEAVIYARFSTDRQSESSIDDQKRVCREAAARLRLEVVGEFEDKGISGAALGNRPGAQAALAALTRGMTLLVTDLSRLSRSQDLAPLLTRLRHRGARVLGVQDGYDSESRMASMQAGLSGIISEQFRDMVRQRTHSSLELRAREKRPTGGRCYGYRGNEIHDAEAEIVREIFVRYADAESCRAIAAALNERGVPSPGSAWAGRSTRRAFGWMGSGIRAMLRNERYRGVLRWNTSEWHKDPDTGIRSKQARPRDEWIEHTDESLRIVPESLWRQVAQRIRTTAEDGNWSAPRGKPQYVLSGLLKCDLCGAHYVIANRHEYSCSSYVNGRACSNGKRVRRAALEEKLLGPVRRELLSPESIQDIARQARQLFAEAYAAREKQAQEKPAQVADLEGRIERLRRRLAEGDPDLTSDELGAAIERAQKKLAALQEQAPVAQESARLLLMLPKAAAEIRTEIDSALKGEPRSAMRVRAQLRGLFGGAVRLRPEADGSLWAHYGLQRGALLQAAVGNRGSGGRI